jgi:hypothetical protein
MKTLIQTPTSVYMSGVAIGAGCGALAVLILLGVLSV